MKPEIVPVGVPNIDLGTFLRVATDSLGYDPARPADVSGKKLSEHEKFLSAVACFHNNTPLTDNHREHLSFTFMAMADRETMFKSMERSGLKHTVADGMHGQQLALISGTLADWKRATLNCCVDESSFQLRLLYDKAYLHFEQLGLKSAWADTRKKSHRDGTFLIEHKQ